MFADKPAPLNWLFLDLNSYFASVEQELRPELRGKPIAVVPVMVDTTCCIAASYEAKAYGVKTGIGVQQAKQLCPRIELVEGRQDLYVDFHHKIVAAVNDCVPVSAVVSIDEMACGLMGREREPQNAVAIAHRIKHAIREQVGETLRCSIGLAPNRFLAKVGSDMQKPDGLTTLLPAQLPDVLYSLKPEDMPGIGPNMNLRLQRQGITTMRQLCALSEREMRAIWGSVVGNRFWHWLRGADFEMEKLPQQSIGHQHVLAPEFRTVEMAGRVGQKLLHKAAVRLRRMQMWAGGMSVYVSFSPWREKGVWEEHLRIFPSQDMFTLLEIFRKVWRDCPPGTPTLVGVALYDLVPDAEHTGSFFAEEEQKRGRLTQVMDALNTRYGGDAVYLAGLQPVRSAAPTRIAFTSIPTFD